MKIGELLKVLEGMDPEGEVVIRSNYEFGMDQCMETVGQILKAETVTGKNTKISVDEDIYEGSLEMEQDEEGISFINLPEGIHLFVELEAIGEC